MLVTLEQGDYGTYLLVADDGQDLLVQVDYDYPSIASNLGWSPMKGPECLDANDQPCDHSCTDGTVDCGACGTKAGDFIASAQEWLDDHIGESFEDPGYFSEEG